MMLKTLFLFILLQDTPINIEYEEVSINCLNFSQVRLPIIIKSEREYEDLYNDRTDCKDLVIDFKRNDLIGFEDPEPFSKSDIELFYYKTYNQMTVWVNTRVQRGVYFNLPYRYRIIWILVPKMPPDIQIDFVAHREEY